ncbi:MAG: V-type ATP synthase subunit F [Patescibacteria group bacterium]|nr:V-type ATP synthase subunit F [Patescibacteria group bacterium]
MDFKIAILGPKDTILGFKAVGLEAHSALNKEQVVEKLYELKKTKQENSDKPKYAIIFVVEDLAMQIPEADLKKLSSTTMPAIIPIPGPKGTTGFGLQRISKIVEQAVGSDILGDK